MRIIDNTRTVTNFLCLPPAIQRGLAQRLRLEHKEDMDGPDLAAQWLLLAHQAGAMKALGRAVNGEDFQRHLKRYRSAVLSLSRNEETLALYEGSYPSSTGWRRGFHQVAFAILRRVHGDALKSLQAQGKLFERAGWEAGVFPGPSPEILGAVLGEIVGAEAENAALEALAAYAGRGARLCDMEGVVDRAYLVLRKLQLDGKVVKQVDDGPGPREARYRLAEAGVAE